MALKPALPEDFVELLQAFVDADVRFLIIGGYAVGVHDRPRTTKDLDLFLDADPRNVSRAIAALRQFGAPPGVIDDLRTSGPDEIVWMGAPPLRVDFLKAIPGIDFGPAWARRVTVEWRDVTVPVISRRDLIVAKRAAGRQRDRMDVANLERAQPRRSPPLAGKKSVKKQRASRRQK